MHVFLLFTFLAMSLLQLVPMRKELPLFRNTRLSHIPSLVSKTTLVHVLQSPSIYLSIHALPVPYMPRLRLNLCTHEEKVSINILNPLVPSIFLLFSLRQLWSTCCDMHLSIFLCTRFSNTTLPANASACTQEESVYKYF